MHRKSMHARVAMWWSVVFGILALGVALAALGRLVDVRRERRAWIELLAFAGPAGAAFDPADLAGLPEPVRRYFDYTIAAGTPLVRAVEIEMTGQLGLGSKTDPRYMPMHAQQILVPPAGLVWRVRAGAIVGSDGVTPRTSWTRFWLFHLLPAVRVGANPDHHRSAFGRVVAEGAFWAPASLLPCNGVTWDALADDVVRATVVHGGFSQALELTIEPDGRPSRVVIERWSNANADKAWRLQPFGGYLSQFREVGGYRLPTHVEGGNFIGTEDYFPFYQADVTAIRFPQLDA